jgi:hypothetical protein
MIDLFLYILFVDVDRFFFIPRASSMLMSCYRLSQGFSAALDVLFMA